MYLLKLIAASLVTIAVGTISLVIVIIKRKWAIQIVMWMYRVLLDIFGVKVEKQFELPETQHAKKIIAIVLNQSSLLDSIICPSVALKPFRTITNLEYVLIPFIGWTAWTFSFVIIRQWHNQSVKTLNRVSKWLKKGGNLGISIEGKRSKDGTLSEFKKGPVVLAINNQVDIVPIVLIGSRQCMPYQSLIVKPGRVVVKFLRPISTIGLTYEDRNALITQLKVIAATQLRETPR